MQTELIKVAEETGLEKTQAETLLADFIPFIQQAKEWEQKAFALVVTDISQKKEMKEARAARLFLKDLRNDAEKVRKSKKEFYLRGGKAIDGINNILVAIIKPLEEHLEKQEKFAEVQEELAKEKLNQERIAALSPFVSDVSFFNLKEMSQEGFEKLLSDSKVAYRAVKDAEKRAEEERLAKEKTDKEEQEKMRVENENLKKDNEAKETELAKERSQKEALEKVEKERKEADEKAKQDALKAETEKAENERKEKERLAAAPDKEKIMQYAVSLGYQINLIELPILSTKEARELVDTTRKDIENIINRLLKYGTELL